jgi:hypothetical protein
VGACVWFPPPVPLPLSCPSIKHRQYGAESRPGV